MKLSLFFLLVFGIVSTPSFSQGCSDAGFCSLKYHGSKEEAGKSHKNSITVGNIVGIADGNTFINGNWIGYSRQLSKRTFADIKLSSNFASGYLANNFNIGDITTSVSWMLTENKSKKSAWQALGGVKIPLTGSNDKAGGLPLPMAYQSSLGTFDLLLGVLYRKNNWEFTHAWQIPLSKTNKNSFFKEYAATDEFLTTNKFGRKSDALLRAGYNLPQVNSWLSLKPNLLAIYHTANDTYEDIFGDRQSIIDSRGLTLNANIIATAKLNNRSSLDLSLATPFIVREIRPDGLTRSFTASLEYKISF